MKSRNLLGGLAAAALVLGLCSLPCAAQSQKAVTLRVSKDKLLLPPSACVVTQCSPGNLRSSGGALTVGWTTDGDWIRVTGSGHAGTFDSGKKTDKVGSLVWASGGTWGWRYTTLTCGWDPTAARPSPPTSSDSSCQRVLSCFVAGTKVLLCDGSEKAIENIPAGTAVQAWDPETSTFKCSVVTEQIKTETDKRFKITTSAGGKALEITPTHRLLVNGAWKDSSEVKVGDTLLYADGSTVRVDSIELIVEEIPVYNLITDFPNDFFAENILVHNENTGADQKDKGFLPRTRVMKADGTQVTIDQIKAGDKIMAWDPNTGRWMHNTVKKIHTGKLEKSYLINGKLRMGTAHVMYKATSQKAK